MCGRQPLKKLKGYGLLKQTISLQIFKGCLPKILRGPFLNTLSHLQLVHLLKNALKLLLDWFLVEFTCRKENREKRAKYRVPRPKIEC